MSNVETFYYDNKTVRNFAYATIFWGVIGMLVGVTIAFQLFLPSWNLGISWTTFSRLRPLHTNAVIFAFVGNGIFMGVYYSLQRLLKARMFSDVLSNIHFWGWQIIIALAAITLPLGYTVSKEYAELEWPIDILITIIWVIFGWNMIGTIMKRRVKNLYVAIWFYIATFFTVALLHVFNSIELPVSFLKSYPVYAGVQDALVQWWYGHNAVAFFLTTPYLGLMYYFLPKAANRPIYSYRLSVIHFWSLIFLYIWAGPHHLLYSALPDWAQSLGTVFSIMLIAPSWGGMLNGLLTLRGAWDRVREDPILKMMVVAVTAYGMSTFEGPMMSLKNINALSHYTDWTIGHVHIGALGWNGLLTFGVLYWLIPRIFKTELYSKKLANIHFWIATLGIIFYAVAMYWTGITQGLMWKQFTPEGYLLYPNFLDTVLQLLPMYAVRATGGTLYFTGALIMTYNLWKTAKQGKLEENEKAQAPALIKDNAKPGYWHEWIESRPVQFFIITTVVVAIGGLVEIIPMYLVKSNVPTIASVKPYTPLELEGRDIYVREGCYVCHSQMIRPFKSETDRYGMYSLSGEYAYDRPFLWGSKRTGPDLLRVGNYRTTDWHENHMKDPASVMPGTIMPAYPHMFENIADIATAYANANTQKQVFAVPYDQEGMPKLGSWSDTQAKALEYAKIIAADMKDQKVKDAIADGKIPEIVALIAYLNSLK